MAIEHGSWLSDNKLLNFLSALIDWSRQAKTAWIRGGQWQRISVLVANWSVLFIHG
jgi:hypothetical protein